MAVFDFVLDFGDSGCLLSWRITFIYESPRGLNFQASAERIMAPWGSLLMMAELSPPVWFVVLDGHRDVKVIMTQQREVPLGLRVRYQVVRIELKTD